MKIQLPPTQRKCLSILTDPIPAALVITTRALRSPANYFCSQFCRASLFLMWNSPDPFQTNSLNPGASFLIVFYFISSIFFCSEKSEVNTETGIISEPEEQRDSITEYHQIVGTGLVLCLAKCCLKCLYWGWKKEKKHLFKVILSVPELFCSILRVQSFHAALQIFVSFFSRLQTLFHLAM